MQFAIHSANFGINIHQISATARNRTGRSAFGLDGRQSNRQPVRKFRRAPAYFPVSAGFLPSSSNYAVVGLYCVDGTAPERARQVTPSPRGELEITTLLESYLRDGTLSVRRMGRGYAWLDTGTHASLLDAGNFVRTLTERQGQQVGSPDEVAYNMGWIDQEKLSMRAQHFAKNDYGRYLKNLTEAGI